jgi:hypothetical protein
MVKVFIVCLCLLFVVRCVDEIQSATEVRKIVVEKQLAEELEMYRVQEENESYRRRMIIEEQLKRDIRMAEREVMKATIDQTMADHCTKHHDEVVSMVQQAIVDIKEMGNMQGAIRDVPRNIAFCLMDLLMTSLFYVEYNINHRQFLYDLDKSADQSRIVMESSSLCSNTIVYAIPCGTHRKECMIFDTEFNQCVDTNEFYDCDNASHYAGLEQVGIIQSMFMCV